MEDEILYGNDHAWHDEYIFDEVTGDMLFFTRTCTVCGFSYSG